MLFDASVAGVDIDVGMGTVEDWSCGEGGGVIFILLFIVSKKVEFVLFLKSEG